jgi:hypothetical protein
VETHLLTLLISFGKGMNLHQGQPIYDSSADLAHCCLSDIMHRVFIGERQICSVSHSLCVLPATVKGEMSPLLCLSAVIVYSGRKIQHADSEINKALQKGWEAYSLSNIDEAVIGITMGRDDES